KLGMRTGKDADRRGVHRSGGIYDELGVDGSFGAPGEKIGRVGRGRAPRIPLHRRVNLEDAEDGIGQSRLDPHWQLALRPALLFLPSAVQGLLPEKPPLGLLAEVTAVLNVAA